MTAVGPADLLRAIAAASPHGEPSELVQVAQCLGYRYVPPRIEISEAREGATVSDPTPDASAASPSERPASASRPVPFLRMVGATFAPEPNPDPLGPDDRPLSREGLPRLGRLLPAAPPRWRPAAIAPGLYEAISDRPLVGAPNVPQLVDDVSRARALDRIPRRPRRRAVPRLRIILDRAPDLAPAWTDGELIADWCDKWAPSGAVEIVRSTLGRLDWPASDPHVATLLVTDAGLGSTGPTPRARRWAEDGRVRAAAGERAVLWLLGGLDNPTQPTLRPWHAVIGDTSAAALDSDEVDRLLALASLALQVEAGLLRELRALLPSRDARIELVAWRTEGALSRGNTSTAQWGPDAFRQHRAALRKATSDWLTPEVLRAALHAIARYRVLAVGSDETIYWSGEFLWNEEVASWRQLAIELPPDHQAAVLGYLDERGWLAVNQAFMKDLRASARLPSGPASVGQAELRGWFERLQRYEPVSAWADEGGLFHPVAEALGAELDAVRCHLVQSSDGLILAERGGSAGHSPVATVHTSSRITSLRRTGHRDDLQVGGEPLPVDPSAWAPSAPEPGPSTEWADRTGKDKFGHWAEVDIEGVPLEMRWIEPGTFWMGSPEDEAGRYGDEGPRHQVTLTEGYWMAERPCTQALWRAVMGDNPSKFSGEDRPVEQVSWEDVSRFIETVNARVPDLALRLPTEAQWEHACRAGTDDARYGEVDAIAWFSDNSAGETHPVGERAANAWGLHDMLGNVWEWCHDRWLDHYDSGHAIDPMGPDEGSIRVLRGGSWLNTARGVRAASRSWYDPSLRYSYFGFRLSRGPSAPSERPGRGAPQARPGPPLAEPGGQGASPPRRIAGSIAEHPDAPTEKPAWASSFEQDEHGVRVEVEVPAKRGRTVHFGLRWIPPGTFQMGSPESDEEAFDSERPQHPVTLTEAYWMAETPCTQAVWQAVMAENPSAHQGDSKPVETVSWKDASTFVETLNARVPGLELRLPTEAQWEYACRAGTESPRYGELDAVAWHGGNSGAGTHPVGQKRPNPWGLHDTLGNVYEWCQDRYGAYDSGHAMDPMGPDEGTLRVLRGGGWFNAARRVRAASRYWGDPSRRDSGIGFRLSRGHSAPSEQPGRGAPQARPGPPLAEPGGQGASPSRRSRAGRGESGIVLITDRATARLDVFERPRWAAEVGRDRFGLFAEVEVDAFVPAVFRMRWMPPGRFQMGEGDGQHLVTLTEGYWMAETPCTQALWEAVAGDNPSEFKGGDRPVETVSWDDTQSFLRTLNERVPGLGAGLPTEAQWEYACRAGTDGERWGEVDAVAWYEGNSGGGSRPVRAKAPNPWGLYDTLGNVWEWCHDRYGDYHSGHAIDPMGPDEGSSRVLRGGSWCHTARYVRAAVRDWDAPSSRYSYFGFRLSRGPSAPSQPGQPGPEARGRPGPRGTSGQGADPEGGRSPSVAGGGEEPQRSWWARLFGRKKGEED